jgi:hypothetical protein
MRDAFEPFSPSVRARPLPSCARIRTPPFWYVCSNSSNGSNGFNALRLALALRALRALSASTLLKNSVS